MGIKRNKEADRAAKDMSKVTTRLPYTLLTIRRARKSEWQREWENSNSKLHYIKPSIEECLQ